MKLLSRPRAIWRWIVRNRLIVGVVASIFSVLFLGGLWIYWNWEWFAMASPYMESRSTTTRNLGLVAGGFMAILLAIWRSIVADRQAKASQQQAETSQRVLLNERHQKGAEMLGSKVLSARLGGIYALQRLAEEEPEQYHIQIMRLLSAFVRHPTKDEDDKTVSNGLREDVQVAMKTISDCIYSFSGSSIEKKMRRDLRSRFDLNLTGANLTDADLVVANLTGTNLTDANLTNADLLLADLTHTILVRANLTGADLTDANLTGAFLNLTNLTGANLSKAKGLTQKQLDQACADPDNPPKLDGLRDAETDLPLEWRGKPRRS